MIPIDQTIFSSTTERGNCLQACVASLLGIHIDAVPTFHTMGRSYWQKKLIQFMYQHEYDYYGLLDPLELANSNGHVIVYGSTERSEDIMHAVIYLNGKLVHDPHPSRAGLKTVMYGFCFVKRQYD